jgi:hypothetical protein
MRTIIEVLVCTGFVAYLLWSAGRILALMKGVTDREAIIHEQSAANYDLLAKFQKLNATVTEHQNLQRKKIAEMQTRVDVMHAAQVAQSLSN